MAYHHIARIDLYLHTMCRSNKKLFVDGWTDGWTDGWRYGQWRTGPTGPPAHGRWAPAVSHFWGPSVSSNWI